MKVLHLISGGDTGGAKTHVHSLLAGLTPRKAKGTPYAGGPLEDKMIVLCGLGNQLDELLPVLRQAGAGPGCLKAVLTAHNKKWTAPALLTQLRKEQAMMQKKI